MQLDRHKCLSPIFSKHPESGEFTPKFIIHRVKARKHENPQGYRYIWLISRIKFIYVQSWSSRGRKFPQRTQYIKVFEYCSNNMSVNLRKDVLAIKSRCDSHRAIA